MANEGRKHEINFNVLLDKELDKMLVAIAGELNTSKAHVCREAIRRWNEMLFHRTPRCADGQACRCPHAHIYAPSQPPGDPDRIVTNH